MPQPRLSMRSASQKSGEVGVRRDVAAVDVDVVARVRDDGQLPRSDDVEEAAGELGTAGPPGQHDDAQEGVREGCGTVLTAAIL